MKKLPLKVVSTLFGLWLICSTVCAQTSEMMTLVNRRTYHSGITSKCYAYFYVKFKVEGDELNRRISTSYFPVPLIHKHVVPTLGYGSVTDISMGSIKSSNAVFASDSKSAMVSYLFDVSSSIIMYEGDEKTGADLVTVYASGGTAGES